MRYQAGSCCPCQCPQVSNLLPAPSQVMGWATPGKEEGQPAPGQGLATRNSLPCPQTQTATSLRSQKTWQAHPSPPPPLIGRWGSP